MIIFTDNEEITVILNSKSEYGTLEEVERFTIDGRITTESKLIIGAISKKEITTTATLRTKTKLSYNHTILYEGIEYRIELIKPVKGFNNKVYSYRVMLV